MKQNTHGGKRENAGRKKEGNIQYQRRIHPDYVKYMDKLLNELKNDTIGWIKIESEKDLPKEIRRTQYHVFKHSNQYRNIINNFSKADVKSLWEQGEITHYQPITKPDTSHIKQL